MANDKRALLGTHGEDYLVDVYSEALKIHGYDVSLFSPIRVGGKLKESVLETTQRLIYTFLEAEHSDYKYGLVVMDANLGSPGSEPKAVRDFSSYEIVQRRLNKDLKLICFSGNSGTVKQAKQEGFDAVLNVDLVSRLGERLVSLEQ
jgi:hypothetical protein